MSLRHSSNGCSKNRRRTLSAVLMRSGTSKGLYIHRFHLPESEDEWAPIILSAMGSGCGDKRQLDGVGGATSTTSKVAVVSKSNRPGIDVDYQFVQVAVGDNKIDMSGNCGNMASGVGPFALDEGLVIAKPGQKELDIRVFNTNTGRVIVETVAVSPERTFLEEGDHRIAGFSGSGSRIKMNFLDPEGSMTGKLFPSGVPQDDITVEWPGMDTEVRVRATLIDAANPFVFVESSTMPDLYHELGPDSPESLALIDALRREGAVLLGLAPTAEAAKLTRGTPKIAVLSSPEVAAVGEIQPNIDVTAFSMGKVHPSLQLTGSVCLGTAVGTPGTVASKLSRIGELTEDGDSQKADDAFVEGEVCIAHRSGQILADIMLSDAKNKVAGVSVDRTAQRLFDGNIILRT